MMAVYTFGTGEIVTNVSSACLRWYAMVGQGTLHAHEVSLSESGLAAFQVAAALKPQLKHSSYLHLTSISTHINLGTIERPTT